MSARDTDEQARLPSHADPGSSQRPALRDPQLPADANLEAIAKWEQQANHARSRGERFVDTIMRAAASSPVVPLHVGWFGGWILANLGFIPGVEPFDPFPFPLLTMVVSLEAIFLSLFVLGSQNRLSKQADKRSHLDLQIDLLAEQEMTAVLRLLHDIARHLNVKVSVQPAEVRELAKRTDIHRLTDKLETLEEESGAAPKPKG